MERQFFLGRMAFLEGLSITDSLFVCCTLVIVIHCMDILDEAIKINYYFGGRGKYINNVAYFLVPHHVVFSNKMHIL